MQKYLVSILTAATIFSTSVSPALADDRGGLRGFFDRLRSGDRQERQQDDEKDRSRLREDEPSDDDAAASESEKLRLKLKQKTAEALRSRLEAFWDKAADRLANIIIREERVSAKIAQRLTTLAAAGKDVTRQRELLADADAAIADARGALDAAVVTLQQMFNEQKPVADIIASARSLHKQVVGDIRTAHAALVDVIVSTRGMSLTPSPTP